MTLDYQSVPPSPPRDLRAIYSGLIFAASWFIYAAASAPAINQRGFPPLDPNIQGRFLLWVAAVPLTALFESYSKSRRNSLLIYAVATGFIDALSWPWMVPNHINPGMALVSTLIFYGPLHVIISAAVELLARCIARLTPASLQRLTASVYFRTLLALLIFTCTALLPYAYARYDTWRLERQGRSLADSDWNAGKACVFKNDPPKITTAGGVQIEIHVDPVTRLLVERQRFSRRILEAAYNKEIHDLLLTHGTPPWAAPLLPTAAQFESLVASDDFTEITKFPFDVNPAITLIHGGTVSRWGGSATSSGPGLAIVTKDGFYGVDNERHPTFILRSPAFPQLIFIRSGSHWFAALDEEGNILAETATK